MGGEREKVLPLRASRNSSRANPAAATSVLERQGRPEQQKEEGKEEGRRRRRSKEPTGKPSATAVEQRGDEAVRAAADSRKKGPEKGQLEKDLPGQQRTRSKERLR